MRLSQLAEALDLTRLTPLPAGHTSGPGDDPDITRGYASDLLSDVLAHAPVGGILLTLQAHLNVIAVADHAGLAAVVFTAGRRPDDEVITKAFEEGIVLFTSPVDTFELAGRLHRLGITGGGV